MHTHPISHWIANRSEGPDGRVHPRLFHGVPHLACIKEEGQLHACTVEGVEGGVLRLTDGVLQVPRPDRGNLVELIGGVVGKVDGVPDPAHHPTDVLS